MASAVLRTLFIFENGLKCNADTPEAMALLVLWKGSTQRGGPLGVEFCDVGAGPLRWP